MLPIWTECEHHHACIIHKCFKYEKNAFPNLIFIDCGMKNGSKIS